MAKKRIINKRKPKPKSKVPVKQTKPEERLKQKQKQIVNVKVNIDQSKTEMKDSTPKMGGYPNVINTYPLYQEQPRVPAVIFNNPPNTNPTNTTTNNYSQTNHFQSPEEGVRTGFNIPTPTYHRSHNPASNRGGVRVEEPVELPPRQNDFQNPEEQARTGNFIYEYRAPVSRELNSMSDIYRNNSSDENNFNHNPMRLNTRPTLRIRETPQTETVPVADLIANIERRTLTSGGGRRNGGAGRGNFVAQRDVAQQPVMRRIRSPETDALIYPDTRYQTYRLLLQNYSPEQMELYDELRDGLTQRQRTELAASLRDSNDRELSNIRERFSRQ